MPSFLSPPASIGVYPWLKSPQCNRVNSPHNVSQTCREMSQNNLPKTRGSIDHKSIFTNILHPGLSNFPCSRMCQDATSSVSGLATINGLFVLSPTSLLYTPTTNSVLAQPKQFLDYLGLFSFFLRKADYPEKAGLGGSAAGLCSTSANGRKNSVLEVSGVGVVGGQGYWPIRRNLCQGTSKPRRA